jgi:hypothetical protein
MRLFIAGTAMFFVGSPAFAQTTRLADLEWMAGCWERTTPTGRIVEYWRAPANGVMLGASYAVTDTSMREREQLRIWVSADTVVYEAHPASQARTQFRMAGPVAGDLAFENLTNDFPQRVLYRRHGPDSLTARIEGDRSGRRQPVTYPFKAAPCRGIGLSASFVARVDLQRLYDEMAIRSQREFGARWEWFADHALPGYTFTVWSVPGSAVAAWDVPQLRRNVASARSGNAPMEETRASVTAERVLVRGDTIDALVTATTTRFSTDTTGQRHERVTFHRWLDTWIRQGSGPRLLATRAMKEEVRQDGKLIVIDGRLIGQ